MKSSFRLALTLLVLRAAVGAAQPAAQPTSEQASEQRAVHEALARYRDEPSVREVIAALHARERSSTEGLAERARLSGWVPALGLKARRGQAVDLASSSDEDALKLSTDDDLTLEASLTFDFGRVVFAREEVSIARQAHAEREHEGERVRELIALYFERRRLQVERDLLLERAAQRDTPAPDEDTSDAGEPSAARAGRTAGAARAPSSVSNDDAIVARNVRIAEIEALLDAFTGGAFRRMMARPHAAKAP